MRSDMHEVIIERPRWAHQLGYPRTFVRNRTRAREDDALPLREAMGRFYGEKSLSENLAPLRRYLRSQVGRPWSKVRSEIAQQISATSAVKKHVMDHLSEYVVERVEEDAQGRVWGADRYGRPSQPRWFYVHPRSGALEAVEKEPRKQKSRARVARPDVRVLSKTLQLRRVRGIWYEVVIAELPAWLRSPPPPVRDALAKVNPRECKDEETRLMMQDLWRSGRYAKSARQLSKREIVQVFSGGPQRSG